jgi:hypothetical protein
VRSGNEFNFSAGGRETGRDGEMRITGEKKDTGEGKCLKIAIFKQDMREIHENILWMTN